jgi:hemolysin activation/secretion protein
MRSIWRKAIALAVLLAAHPAAAQNQPEPDRSDPAVLERENEQREREQAPQPRVTLEAPERPTAGGQNGAVVAGAIRVQGAVRLPASAFAREIESFLGRPLEQRDLVQLATAVANVARRAGYGLATAWVPAQDVVNGVLVVRIDEGRIDEVRAQGPGAQMVEQRLASVAGGKPVRTEELERELMLAGDMAGFWVGEARLVRERGRNILAVRTRYEGVQVRINIDNWGSETVGPVRAWGEAAVRGLAQRGDELSLGIATTPFEPGTFQLIEAHYRLPLGGRGTTLAVGGYYGRTDVEADGASAGFTGDSWELEIEASHALVRSRARSLWLTGRFELRDSELERGGTRVRDDRIASATASLYGYDRFAGGRLRGRISVVQGLDLFDATRPGDPLASRADASGVFTKAEAWLEYRRSLGGGFSTQIAARAQVADGPLLSSEEMGLGGPDFLRAFDYREQSGDEGIAGSIELRFDIRNISQIVENVQLYSYADAGQVTNVGPNGRSGSLASAGGGVRFSLDDGWEAGVEVGVPLTDGDRNRDPEPRFSFSVRARF